MDAGDRTIWAPRVRRLVVKIGSRVLVNEHQGLDESRLASLVAQMAGERKAGREVICVSSGAVAAGLREMGFKARPTDLPSVQAAAAIGQARLMQLYRNLFGQHNLIVAQVLLTHADLRSRERHLNARNTFSTLLEHGVVPIVNENDTVSVEEIRFGDNDQLSALVAMLVHADLLVMLTTTEGLLTRPPELAGELVPHVPRVTKEVTAMAGAPASTLSLGGMRSKVLAAEMVTRAGERVVIANGSIDGVVGKILAGENVGTLFEPRTEKLGGRKRWIAFFDHPKGLIRVDDGAGAAVASKGRSLLPVGVTAVEGSFARGEPVRILGPDGSEIARGLVNYSADEVRRLAGRKTSEIAEILGRRDYEEIVHRDNMVLA
jgi:glutamate 5-kinase